jgi:predicted RNA-binding Zn-ribbon protein involved in translation (DUF1610 family)
MSIVLDITTSTTLHEVKAAVLFVCPYCGGEIRASMRLSYPERAVGAYAPVYRCGGRNSAGCGRYIGALIVRDVVE